jgi:hypothetical protein
MQQEIDWLQAQSPCDSEVAAQAAKTPAPSKEVLMGTYMSGMGLVPSLQSLTDGGI